MDMNVLEELYDNRGYLVRYLFLLSNFDEEPAPDHSPPSVIIRTFLSYCQIGQKQSKAEPMSTSI